eukprot:gene24603-30968_t
MEVEVSSDTITTTPKHTPVTAPRGVYVPPSRRNLPVSEQQTRIPEDRKRSKLNNDGSEKCSDEVKWSKCSESEGEEEYAPWKAGGTGKPPSRTSSTSHFTSSGTASSTDKIMSRDAIWANDLNSASWRGSSPSSGNIEHTSSNIQIALNLLTDSRPETAPISDEVLAQCTLIVSGFVSEQSDAQRLSFCEKYLEKGGQIKWLLGAAASSGQETEMMCVFRNEATCLSCGGGSIFKSTRLCLLLKTLDETTTREYLGVARLLFSSFEPVERVPVVANRLIGKPPSRVSSFSSQFTSSTDKIMSRDASWANDLSSANYWRGSNASLNNIDHTSNNIQIALNLPSDSRPDVAPISDEVLAQ